MQAAVERGLTECKDCGRPSRQRPRDLQRAFECKAFGDDLHGDAPLQRLLGVQLLRAPHQVLGTLHAHEAWQCVESTTVRHQADAGEGHAKPRAVGRDHHVGHQCQPKATTVSAAFDRCQHGFVALVKQRDRIQHLPHASAAHVGTHGHSGVHRADVATRAEMAAASRQHDGLHLIVCRRQRHGACKGGAHGHVHGVAPVRAIQGDGGNAAIQRAGDTVVLARGKARPDVAQGYWRRHSACNPASRMTLPHFLDSAA